MVTFGGPNEASYKIFLAERKKKIVKKSEHDSM